MLYAIKNLESMTNETNIRTYQANNFNPVSLLELYLSETKLTSN